MNSLSIRPRTRQHARGRILLIEQDSSRATRLLDIFREHGGVDLEIVEDVPSAIQSLAEQVPDLLLTSTFLRPSDEALLRGRLKELPGAAHVQMISVPYVIAPDDEIRREAGRNVLGFVRRRMAAVRSWWDAETLPEQVQEYLDQARTIRSENDGELTMAPAGARVLVEQRTDEAPALADAGPEPSESILATGACGGSAPGSASCAATERRRAHRRPAADVPSLWAAKVPGSTHVRVIDISSAGALLETSSRFGAQAIELQLLGQDADVRVRARPVRNQVASVDRLGVRYRVAVTFARELDLFGLQPPSAAAAPRDLADVLTRALSETDRGAGAAGIRARFEQELRRLLPVRDIQIRETPFIAEPGAESVYFTVPCGSGPQPILQAIFDPNYAPTAMEFRLLKAAASLAAVALEFAPPGRQLATPLTAQ